MRWFDLVMSWYVLAPLSLLLLFYPPAFLDRFNRFDSVVVLLVLWFAYWTTKAVRNWKRYNQAEKGSYFKRLILFTSILGFFALLWPLSGVLQHRYSAGTLGVLGNNAKGYELHTMDLYPYTAFHPRANCRVRGAMPLEANPMYSDFDVRSGDHGFFVDFDLDDPPPKEGNEFRIILIGGSTAQGFGGQTNNHMLYRVLERRLQEELAKRSLRVRVINLALANSTTYQNFIVLNKWGHALQPDLILSFSGRNDVVSPLASGLSDMPVRFHGVLGLTRSTWVTESPRLMKDAAKYFPALETSVLGVSIRVLNSYDIGRRAAQEYSDSHHPLGSTFPKSYILNLYVHALKSIKRDCQGIPIMVAFQPYDQMADPNELQCYNYLMAQAPERLKGYMNDKWYFRNVHEYFQQQHLVDEEHLHGVHFLNKGHAAAAEFLCKELVPVINEMRSPPRSQEKVRKSEGGNG